MTSKKEERVSKVLRELEQIAIREHLPSVGPIKAKIISAIIQKYKPTTILEIGTLHGYSAILMAADLLPVNDDNNNPWSLTDRFYQMNPDGTYGTGPVLVKQPQSSTNMFAHPQTSLLAMYLFLTGNKNINI